MKNYLAQDKYIEHLAVATLLITFFGFFAVKVWEIDFWWHIAAGKNTLDNFAIPNVDPFGVYDANNVWGQTVLKTQWFGQVLLYTVHRNFGIDGIILFRAAILTLCLFIVYLRCRLNVTPNLFSLGITALVGAVILHFTGDRPQLFLFLYLPLIFLLLDAYLRHNRCWLLYCVPAVMLLWSNTHLFMGYGVKQNLLFQYGIVVQRCSINVVTFIQKNILGGRIFNIMNGGRYLIWNLGKIATVDIGARMSNPKYVLFCPNILWITRDSQQLLEKGDFDLAYSNSISVGKYLTANYLAKHPDWRLIYARSVWCPLL